MPIGMKLFSLTGERFDIAPVVLDANEVRAFDLRSYVPAGSVFEEGNLQVAYTGKNLELGGVVNLVDVGRSLIFDEELTEPATMFSSSRLEGVWWAPSRRSEIRLAISNATDAPLSANVAIEGTAPKQKEPTVVVLGPHQTRVMSIEEIVGERIGAVSTAGGISIIHTGPSGALLARAMIQDEEIGYSNLIAFSDPQTAKSSKLNGAGLRIGQVAGSRLTQAVVARNVGNTETVLTGRVPYTTSDGTPGIVSLRETRLAPRPSQGVRSFERV